MSQQTGPQHDSSFGNLAIDDIVEVTLPDPVSYLPQTVGWKILGFLLICFIAYRLYRQVEKWWSNRYRRAALEAVAEISSSKGRRPTSEILMALSELLKATALHVYPRDQIAGLFGERWIQFLNQQAHLTNKKHGKEGNEFFDHDSTHLLSVTVYQSTLDVSDQQIDRLISQVERWVKDHPESSVDKQPGEDKARVQKQERGA